MPQIIINATQAVHGGTLGLLSAGSTQDVPVDLATALVGRGAARWVTPPVPVIGMLDIPAAPVQALVSGAGAILWAARPTAASAGAGATIVVSDCGYSTWRSDGTNWRPSGGSYMLLNRAGSAATPVASLVSAGAAILMASPLAGLKIPAGMIIPGLTKLRLETYWNKTGAAAGINCIVCLGTTNSFSDSQTGNQFIGAAANSVWRQFSDYMFDTSNACTETVISVAVGAATGAVSTPLRNTNINTNADMFLNWGTTSSTAGDGLQAFSATVTLFL